MKALVEGRVYGVGSTGSWHSSEDDMESLEPEKSAAELLLPDF